MAGAAVTAIAAAARASSDLRIVRTFPSSLFLPQQRSVLFIDPQRQMNGIGPAKVSDELRVSRGKA
jgi:hypothetical protein